MADGPAGSSSLMLVGGTTGHRYLVTYIAGTGTILDAWRAEIPLVVVPNKGLLDDHQTEMAKHLAYEGYAIDAKAEYVHTQTDPVY